MSKTKKALPWIDVAGIVLKMIQSGELELQFISKRSAEGAKGDIRQIIYDRSN